MHDVRVWAFVVMVACTQSEAAERRGPESGCAHELFTGFATPQQAYTTYAAALNEKDYCRAANTYAKEQRPELATSMLTALVLTAGTAPVHQELYRARLEKICAKYELSCASEARLKEIVQALQLGKPLQSLEPKLANVAKQVPEDVFSAVMNTLAEVDANAVGQLSPELEGLDVQGEHAKARAERAGRRATPVLFRKDARGWMLALH